MPDEDPLDQALHELSKIEQFERAFGPLEHKTRTFVYEPLSEAIRLLVDEVRRLRELVGSDPGITSDGIQVFDPEDRPWER